MARPRKTVLVGGDTKYIHRVVPQSDTAVARSSKTGIPKRIEGILMALYITFVKDIHDSSYVLTREELDLNPETKSLPSTEKDLMVEYWPQFVLLAQQSVEIGKARQEHLKLVRQAHKDAAVMKKKYGISDAFSESEQLKLLSSVHAGQFKEAALVLAAMPPLTLETPEIERKLWKDRADRVRTFAWIAKVSADLAVRIEETSSDSMQSVSLPAEAKEFLLQADLELHQRGFGHLASTEMVDDSGQE